MTLNASGIRTHLYYIEILFLVSGILYILYWLKYINKYFTRRAHAKLLYLRAKVTYIENYNLNMR